MGITERREREKIERKRTILNSARELILLQGVDRVSMEDIARKAELSKATVYLYFSCKEILFNEICEESARGFWGNFRTFLETGLTGLKALKYFWQGYVELFGSSDEMIIVFQVRNFLNSWLPIVSQGEASRSTSVDAILDAMKTIIDQCKAEGIFAPNLDSAAATRLLLSLFSVIVGNAARIPPEARKSPALIEEMTKSFQIIIYGFAREGLDRSSLDLMNN
jgi:AcrR family transcriptional regulator